MKTIIERSTSLDIAEKNIDTYFKNENISVKLDYYGAKLSSTVVTLTLSDSCEEACIGCGKGYETEARIGAKYEAYEHLLGLTALRKNSILVPFSSVMSQPEINTLFPLKILSKSSPDKISVIPFNQPDGETNNNLLYPSFLIDYNYPQKKMYGDDADYSAARRYSCGTGIAAGFGYTEAAIHAASEVIERHCVGRFLAKKFFYEIDSSITRIEPRSLSKDLQKVLYDAEKYLGGQVFLIDLSYDNLLAVFITCCPDRDISGVNIIGAGCSRYPSHAANRAIKELVQQYAVAEGVDIVKNEWLKHIKHLTKYPKLLKCLKADLSGQNIVFKNMASDPDIIPIDDHLTYIIETCRNCNLPIWIKKIHKDETGINIVCAVMPKMERFSIISLGNYVIPTNKYF